ncbi:MAG: hypothetical protein DI586_11075 [Micavibrio aeruginosavorus]|uniref:Uncharacterized protein n=1 Tax=Micavibrio aeruginosavorus TaxID=349221 RepID=A0A2W5HI51_9BACT|nr:MAG: hypothetical protein DI586_11075 [Micavibrio aeruginosavorus]
MTDTQKINLKWDEGEVINAIVRDYMLEDASLKEKETYTFSELLSGISQSGDFYVRGYDLGWKKRSGSAKVSARNAREFISRVFPQTSDWSLDGEMTQGRNAKLNIRLYHHDAPTGERYEIEAGE